MSKFLTLVNGVKRHQLVDELDLVNLKTAAPILTPGGRLCLSLSVPFGDNQSSAAFLRYTAATGNLVPTYDGSAWIYNSIGDAISLSLTGLSDGLYDIFYQAGTGLEAVAWTNNTTRADPIGFRDGLYMKSGTRQNTYLGTVRIDGSSKIVHDPTRRDIWNMYNQKLFRLIRLESAASWTYNSPTGRNWNNSALNRIGVVCGLPQVIDMSFIGRVDVPVNAGGMLAMGVNNLTAVGYVYTTSLGNSDLSARITPELSIGYNYVQAIEVAFGGITVTFRGDNAYGMRGTWLC